MVRNQMEKIQWSISLREDKFEDKLTQLDENGQKLGKK